MNVTCADCASVFRVDPAKVPAAGVLARCSVCGAVISVRAAAVAPDVASVELAGPVPALQPGADATAAGPGVRPDESAAPVPARPSPRITPRGPAPAAAEPPSSASGSHAAQPSAAAQPRRFNPFLSNDPSQKARRLARALVSDLVAYNPQKREEGLRAGNLKELFRDEIRKSWAEYVEQVGSPIAEGTTHFQDALNDVLAGGRKMF